MMKLLFAIVAIGCALCSYLFFRMHTKLLEDYKPMPFAFKLLGYLIVILLIFIGGFAVVRVLH